MRSLVPHRVAIGALGPCPPGYEEGPSSPARGMSCDGSLGRAPTRSTKEANTASGDGTASPSCRTTPLVPEAPSKRPAEEHPCCLSAAVASTTHHHKGETGSIHAPAASTVGVGPQPSTPAAAAAMLNAVRGERQPTVWWVALGGGSITPSSVAANAANVVSIWCAAHLAVPDNSRPVIPPDTTAGVRRRRHRDRRHPVAQPGRLRGTDEVAWTGAEDDGDGGLPRGRWAWGPRRRHVPPSNHRQRCWYGNQGCLSTTRRQNGGEDT